MYLYCKLLVKFNQLIIKSKRELLQVQINSEIEKQRSPQIII